MTADDNTKDDEAREAALSLLAEGLITKAEASRLAGVSRQIMGYWAKEIDVERARDAHLARIWRKKIGRRKK